MKVYIPHTLKSEANLQPYGKKGMYAQRDRKKKLLDKVALLCKSQISPHFLPCTVILRRIAPRHLDGDNLAYAFKPVRDFIAGLLVPGLAKGRADDDSRIQWKYDQAKGNPKEYAIEIEVVRVE